MMKMFSALAFMIVAAFAAVAAEQAPAPYPLKVCVVSGEKLGGDMGKPFVFESEGRMVELCCSSCKKEFDRNPGKYLEKIKAAAEKN